MMSRRMHVLAAGVALCLAGCGPAPAPERKPEAAAPRTDPASEPWYSEAVRELESIEHEASQALESGRKEQAAAAITRGQTVSSRLLAIPRPTLRAMEAASGLDHLYGRMLLENRNYGWARLFFQKNVARWKNWMPQTPETARRLKQARDAIAECDRKIGQ
jgi:hypothetical protein